MTGEQEVRNLLKQVGHVKVVLYLLYELLTIQNKCVGCPKSTLTSRFRICYFTFIYELLAIQTSKITGVFCT
jgi:hypothetical protein